VALKSSLVRWVEWIDKDCVIRAITEKEWIEQKKIPQWATELQAIDGKATVFSLPKGVYPKCWELKQYVTHHLPERGAAEEAEEID